MKKCKEVLKSKRFGIFFLFLILLSVIPKVEAAGTVVVDGNNFSTFFKQNGHAIISGDTATLTPDQVSQSGVITLSNYISLKNSFTLNGSVNLGTKLDDGGGGDGIGFAFHPNSVSSIGNTGANMGIGGLKNAIGFKLDTYKNGQQDPVKDSNSPDYKDPSRRLGWQKDPRARLSTGSLDYEGETGHAQAPFGAFVTANSTDGYLTLDENSVQFLNNPTNILTPSKTSNFLSIVFNYVYNQASNSGKITIQYNGQTWSYSVGSDYITRFPNVAFSIGAGTGNNRNLQQFKLSSFNYDAVKRLTIKKNWEDSTNQYGNRPSQLAITVLGNGSQVGNPVMLTADNNWQTTLSDLPAVDTSGKEITYTVKEETVPAGYSSGTPVYGAETATITNTLNTRTIKLVKKWIDATNKDGKQPSSLALSVQPLNKDGKTLGMPFVATVMKDSWTTTVTLPTYVNQAEVKKLAVTEGTVPTGYQLTSVTPSAAADIPSDGTYTVTNTQVMTIPVKKVWNDRDNFLGKRKTVTVNLLQNGTSTGQTVDLATTNNWAASFTNIAKYGTDGKALNYSVQETTNVSGYQTPTYAGDSTNGFTVTNTLSSVPVQLIFKKVNGAGEALANVDFTLSGGNLSSPISATSQSDGTVSFSPQNLTPGEYQLTEKVPVGYTGTVTQTAFTIGNDYAIRFPTGSSGTVTSTSTKITVDLKSIVNTLKPFDVTITKTGRFNQFLSGAHFQLKSGNRIVNSDNETDSTDSNGSLTFSNLTVGSYTLEEITAPEGYVRLSQPLTFTVATNGSVTLTGNGDQAGTLTSNLTSGTATNTISLTVKNQPKGLLPATGGAGIRFYLILASFLAGVAIFIGSYLGYRALRGRAE